MKTNKRGVILVVSLWAIFGGVAAVAYVDTQAIRAEERDNRLFKIGFRVSSEMLGLVWMGRDLYERHTPTAP